MTSLDRITVAARAFCIAAILGLSLVTGNVVALQATVLLAALAGSASFVAVSTRIPQFWVAAFEAVIIGLLVGLILPSPSALLLLPYLAIPALSAGIAQGMSGLLGVVFAETTSLFVLVFLPLSGRSELADLLDSVATWLLTSLGVGLLGVWLRHYGKIPPQPDSSYESARRLLTQLRTVARRLSSGLDTGSMAIQLLAAVNDHLHPSRAVVFIRTEGGILTPIGYDGLGAREQLRPDDEAVTSCWEEFAAVTLPHPSEPLPSQRLALPLRVGTRMIGVVLADRAEAPPGEGVSRLMAELDDHALRLDAALAFDEVRSVATQEERHRLAREIHDGVAQEIASLGYVVDEIHAQAQTDEQRESLRILRSELTRVVGELRHSIFDLRSDISPSAGIGSVLSDYVREVGTRSGITVHLTLDESPVRLRSEVETELLRIAQEAITNARKHSGADNLWVDCRILPPFARVTVTDDGNGLVESREGSYGLKIMRERAQRIDARLEIRPGSGREPGQGTSVVITVGSEPQASPISSKDVPWQSVR